MAVLGHRLEGLGEELGSKEKTECLLDKRGRTFVFQVWNFPGTNMEVDIMVEK